MPQPHLLPVPDDRASDCARAVFSEIKRVKEVAHVPAFFRTIAIAEDVLQGTWALYSHVCHVGELSLPLKELIFVAVARAKRSTYCENVHVAFCRQLRIDERAIRFALTDPRRISPRAHGAMVEFAVLASHSPATARRRFASLRRRGWSDAEIMEGLAMAALATYAAVICDVVGLATTPADEACA